MILLFVAATLGQALAAPHYYQAQQPYNSHHMDLEGGHHMYLQSGQALVPCAHSYSPPQYYEQHPPQHYEQQPPQHYEQQPIEHASGHLYPQENNYGDGGNAQTGLSEDKEEETVGLFHWKFRRPFAPFAPFNPLAHPFAPFGGFGGPFWR